jgi:Rieske Fe-S protein
MDKNLIDSFPVDWEDDNYVTRREFLKFGTVASGAFAVGSVGIAAWGRARENGPSFEPRMIALTGDIEPGNALPFNFPREKDLALLIQKPDGEFVAYARRCTHLSCPVVYEAAQSRLFCPCHNGAFSVEDGSVLQGPPPHPIPQIEIEIRGDEIWAIGVKLHGGHA